MESVYLETTFISYLVARPSRDVIIAGHQQTTQDWWANRRSQLECSVSQVVIDEASVGDPVEVQKRLAIIGGLPTLEVTEDAKALTQAIMAAGILPPHAFPDAAHIAVSAVHAVDYLLTWNCKHLANAQIARRIAMVCEKLNHKMPIICTPEELMELSIVWEDPIVAEVHRAREKLAADCNYDVEAFFAGVRERQASLGSRLVRQRRPAEPTAEADRGCPTASPGSTPSDAAPAA